MYLKSILIYDFCYYKNFVRLHWSWIMEFRMTSIDLCSWVIVTHIWRHNKWSLFWGKSYGFSSVILLFPRGRFCFWGVTHVSPVLVCLAFWLVSSLAEFFSWYQLAGFSKGGCWDPPDFITCPRAHWHTPPVDTQWLPTVQHRFWPGCLKSVRACGAGTDAFHLCVVLTLGEQTSGRHKHNCLFWLTMTSS